MTSYRERISYYEAMEKEHVEAGNDYRKSLAEHRGVEGDYRNEKLIDLYIENIGKVENSLVEIRAKISDLLKAEAGYTQLTDLVSKEPGSGWEFYTTNHNG